MASHLVEGAWVRYCIGIEAGQSIYRACEVAGKQNFHQVAWRFCILTLPITEVASKLVNIYKVNGQPANQELILRHGNSEKNFPMDRISNTPITEVRPVSFVPLIVCSLVHQKEFTRILRVYDSDKLKFPSKRHCEKKATQIEQLCSQSLTEVTRSLALCCLRLHRTLRRPTLQQ